MSLLNRINLRARKQFLESSVLFVNILRWTILATIVGAIVGGSTAVFIFALHSSIYFMQRIPYYFAVLPFGLWLSARITKTWAPFAAGHGTEKVIEAVHQKSGKMNPLDAPVKLVATVVTIAAGGSAGKEGPAAQIGATLASVFADITKLSDNDRKKLVICGISAGFSAIFGTPVAGALFGVEVLFLGQILYEVLLPSFIAGITAYQVSSGLGATYFWNQIKWTPTFSEALFFKIILSGVLFGLVSLLFIESLRWGGRFFRRYDSVHHCKPILGGMILLGFGLLGASDGLGLGINTLEKALAGENIPGWLWLFKSAATGITLGCGGSGGVITPIFTVGAAFGSVWGKIIHLDPALCAALGMIAVLAGTTNTPIAASVMGLELFGPSFGPFGATVSVIAFLMTGYRSVYPSQILARAKSEVLVTQLNKPISAETRISIEYTARKRFAKYQRWINALYGWIRGKSS